MARKRVEPKRSKPKRSTRTRTTLTRVGPAEVPTPVGTPESFAGESPAPPDSGILVSSSFDATAAHSEPGSIPAIMSTGGVTEPTIPSPDKTVASLGARSSNATSPGEFLVVSGAGSMNDERGQAGSLTSFTDQESVARWLHGQADDVAVVFAARTALRLVPLLAGARRGRATAAEAALRVFRAVAAAWDVAAYPGHREVLNIAARAVTPTLGNLKGPWLTRAAVYAAATATGEAGATSRAAIVIGHALDGAGSRGREAFELFLRALAADASLLNQEFSTVTLATSPLWPGAIPSWARDDWEKVKAVLLAASENWDVWTEWYEDRLHGQMADQEVEVARATIDEEIWGRDPRAVNAHIRGLLEVRRMLERRQYNMLRAAFDPPPSDLDDVPDIESIPPQALRRFTEANELLDDLLDRHETGVESPIAYPDYAGFASVAAADAFIKELRLAAEAGAVRLAANRRDAVTHVRLESADALYRHRGRTKVEKPEAFRPPPIVNGPHAFTPPPNVPEQSFAPVRVEARAGKIARVSDRDSPLHSPEADFNAWREPILDHVQELLAADFRQGTNHGRARDRLLALSSLLPGSAPDVKEGQFRLGYEIERLEGLIAAYRTGGDDVPELNAAVLEDLDRLRLALKIGISKLERWAEFSRIAAADPLHDGDANPQVIADALDEMAGQMERRAQYFDPEVPAVFRFLAEALRDPRGATKAVVYGAVRSAENLMSFLGQKALGIAKKSVDAVEEHISKAVATGLITGLAAAALQISGALPTGWTWLKPLLDALARASGH